MEAERKNSIMRNSHVPPTDRPILIACDTEFQGPHTLSIQFACRIDGGVAVQVYHSPAVPEMPRIDLRNHLPRRLRCLSGPIVLRPAKVIRPDLSPARVIADLYNNDAIVPVSRATAESVRCVAEMAQPWAVLWIAHFWSADFLRTFGARFFQSLLRLPPGQGRRLIIEGHKTLRFKVVGNRYASPVLDYARTDGLLHPIRVRTLDTMLPFGSGTLQEHSQTFLRVGKAESFATEDMARMEEVFQRTSELAYAYAVRDCLLTLLLAERMQQEDRKLYRSLGFEAKEIPPLQPTQGSRVAEMMVRAIARQAAGSVKLSKRGYAMKDGSSGPVALQRVKALLRRGSGPFLAHDVHSRFGQQTGETHGGLVYSRSPTRFYHEATGQFADVDLGGCYAAIAASLNLYVGQPIVHEPGASQMKLKDAIALLKEHAAGNDAWVIKVTGDITQAPNALIPSTSDALTHANFRSRASRQRAKARKKGFGFDWLYSASKDTGNATLFTHRIEAGIVAWPTWLLIQALPAALRAEYENLEVETMLFYPAQLVADDGPSYDALVDRLACDEVPWSATLELERLRQVIVEKFDDRHVVLRFHLGELVRRLSQLRREARERHGKGSGAERALKQQVNTVYGVIASRHLVTNNVVTANIITATGRALAYAMLMSFNGFQVITDGCIYRRDQVPAGTFADCLRRAPDYPINRAGYAGPFLKSSVITLEDPSFTTWYRRHVMRFFGVSGADYEQLFGLHDLEHKSVGEPERVQFDALCCDGSANYLKLANEGETRKVLEFKARSYPQEAKEALSLWIVKTYSKDNYQGPPPITRTVGLLSFKDAVRVARKALAYLSAKERRKGKQGEAIKVWLPLGLEEWRVKPYKVFKPSQFLFRDPRQRDKFIRSMAKFSESSGCGLEALALRRSHGGRRQGSMVDLVKALYEYIQTGGDKPTKEFNLTRGFKELKRIKCTFFRAICRLRKRLAIHMYKQIDTRKLKSNARLTGWIVDERDLMEISRSGPAG
jgi:hypothetical protein